MIASLLLLLQAGHKGSPQTVAPDLFASSVAGIGDVDGDGHADFAAAACFWQSGSEPEDPSRCGVCAFSGKDGKPLWMGAPGLHVQRFFYRSLCPVGDIDGDGRPDLAVLGSRNPSWEGGRRPDLEVSLLSGKDGSTIRRLPDPSGPVLPDFAQIAYPGDVDGDGVADLAIVAAGGSAAGGNARSALWLQSCKTGEILRWFDPDPEWWVEGEWIDCPGDVDGDGIGDIAVVAIARSDDPRGCDGSRRQAVLVRSGRDGRVLVRIEWPPTWGRIRTCGVGDIDGDGHADLALAGASWDGQTRHPSAWEVRIHSGLDGHLLRSIHWAVSDLKGGDITCAGDIDRDGIPDLLVSHYAIGVGGGVRIHSGRDGSILWEREESFQSGENVSEYFGYALAAAGDVDADGFPDWIVAQCTPWGDLDSRLTVFSGVYGTPLWVHDSNSLVLGARPR